MKKYTINNTYFATGEGMTVWYMLCLAENEEKALELFKMRTGDYMSMGAEVKEGFDLDNPLLAAKFKDAIGKGGYGNVVYFTEFHVNYS